MRRNEMAGIVEFLEQAGEAAQEMISDVTGRETTLSYARVVKVNDMMLNGLQMSIEGMDAMPVIYFDPLYEEYENGEVAFHFAVAEIYRAFMQSIDVELPYKYPDDYMDDSDIYDEKNMSVRLLEIDRNVEYLKEHPFKDVGCGFAAVCDIVKFDETGSWRSPISHEFVEKSEYDVDELIDRALENAMIMDPPVMISMEEMMELLYRHEEEPEGIHVCPGAVSYVLTNKSKHYGAAALFYPGVAQKIAEELQGGFYALPSSLSEFIILPAVKCDDMRKLEMIVRKVNRNTVPEEEILSDRVLIYDAEEQRLKEACPKEGNAASVG